MIKEKREHLFWLLAGSVLCLLLIISGLALWVMHDVHTLLATAASQPVPHPSLPGIGTQSSAAPSSASTDAGLRALPPESPTVPTQSVDLPPAAAITVTSDPGTPVPDSAGILLSAEDLSNPQSPPPNPAAIDFVATKMGTLPLPMASGRDGKVQKRGQRETSQPLTHIDFDDPADDPAADVKRSDAQAESTIKDPIFRRHPHDLVSKNDDAEAERQADLQDAIAADTQVVRENTGLSLPPLPSDNPAVTEAAAARRSLAHADLGKAIAAFDRAVRLAPRVIAYRLSLAISYDQAGQNAAALGIYRQVLALAADQDEPSRLGLPLTSIRARAAYLENAILP